MKRITVIFTAVILLLCLVPSAGLALLGPSAARASRDGEFNAELLSDTAEYLDESFYLRQELITLWARVKALFGQSAESGVVLGSDGWLYYADELADFTGTEPLSERELFAAARNLALMSEYVEGLGSRFVFTIAPNKSSLYPEHMPELARSGAATDAERLAEALEAEGVEYLDLFELFRSRSETLYFEHDSHWTSRGAALAADAINSVLGAASAYGGGYEYETRQHTGDLYEMLYPAGTDRETDDVPTALGFSQGEGIRPDSITIDTTGSGRGSLLMLRDSFGQLL